MDRTKPVCTRPSLPHFEDLAWLIDAEYDEIPGLRLTSAETARLWDRSRDDCCNVLDYLVTVGRLAQDEDGRYFRFSDM